jgi:tetratricopeptide (TPR) repeat protein
MDVLISGQAGSVALLGKSVELRRIGAGPIRNFSTGNIGLAFLGCTDVQRRQAKSLDDADALAREAWAKDRALRLFLLLFDRAEPIEALTEYCECLENLVQNPSVELFVKWSLYVDQLPIPFEVKRIKSVIDKYPKASAIFESFLKDQLAIGRVRRALDIVPLETFGDEAARLDFVEEAAQSGAFFDLVQLLDGGPKLDFFILQLLGRLRRIENSRAIIDRWTAGMRTERARIPAVTREVSDEFIIEEPIASGRSSRRAFENAMQQQSAIIGRLNERDLDGARRYANELIQHQRETSSPEHMGKSLSNLSHKAKELGVPELQLEWAAQATEVNPADPITFAHLSDALIGAGRFGDASDVIDKMDSLGAKLSAETGRARILRATGRPTEARERYLAAAKNFPDEPEVWHAIIGAAEVLRDMGRYDEALIEYKSLTEHAPFEGAVWAGLASVLMDLGNLDEAIKYFGIAATHSGGTVAINGRATAYKLSGNFSSALRLYDEALREFPNDAALLCGRAEVLRAQGDLPGALEAYNLAIERAPYLPIPLNGKAEVLKELRRYSEAADVLKSATKHFPYDQVSASGYAGLLKARGRYDEALAQYDEIVRRFPHDVYSQTSRADILRRMRLWNDSLAAYDEILKTRPHFERARAAKAALLIQMGDLVKAETLLPEETPRSQEQWNRYLLRAFLLEAKGRHADGRNILQYGIGNVPFAKQRRLFRAALARLELAAGHASAAVKIVEATPGSITNVIRFHALAASGRAVPARETFAQIGSAEGEATYIELASEIARRFKLIEGNPARSRDWIFKTESEELLLEAA